MDSYAYVQQKKLRRGYTTGTCAAAASLAAAKMLFGEELSKISLVTPKGISLEIDTLQVKGEAGEWAVCGIKKDAGDDPDVTNGIVVFSEIRTAPFKEKDYDDWYQEGSFFLRGGEGIGMVTREGLSCPVGKAAINPVPRKMIFDAVQKAVEDAGYEGKLYIEIRIPEGKEKAKKTFNPHLGIEGGISVLGTSGIVEPMSEAALIETIRLELHQKAVEGQRMLLAVPGNYGAAFLKDSLKLDMKKAVKCSNFIGETIDIAVREGAEGLIFVGHGGKLFKLAAGIMNTHSSCADGRAEVLASYGALCGASRECVEKILNSITVEEGLGYLEQEGILKNTVDAVMKRIEFYLKNRAGREDFFIGACVFTNERGILGMTPGTKEMLSRFALERIEK